MPHVHGFNSHWLRVYLKRSLTYKYLLFMCLFIYWKSCALQFTIYFRKKERDYTFSFNKRSKYLPLAWTHIRTLSTMKIVTLRWTRRRKCVLQHRGFPKVFHLLCPPCTHLPSFLCNPTRENLAHLNTVTAMASAVDSHGRSIGQEIVHSDTAWRS